jgi:hypothetical protein
MLRYRVISNGIYTHPPEYVVPNSSCYAAIEKKYGEYPPAHSDKTHSKYPRN